MEESIKHPARWTVHTPRLLEEILCNPDCYIMNKPIKILGRILYDVASRASELNDTILNDLMMQLTLYEVSDPEHKNYDRKMVESVEAEARKLKQVS